MAKELGIEVSNQLISLTSREAKELVELAKGSDKAASFQSINFPNE